ncbi:aromatic ring-hydroxylating dioxygenase subunit alpha [Erythrobacter westpacificensis]|uniref:Aromatic ring-hydroxylating dioxygenase subunit alpha n=1 Tax=Erythrobacter westpacificensis TaxID=1055231 RepID=A0ABP9K451_9SPHN
MHISRECAFVPVSFFLGEKTVFLYDQWYLAAWDDEIDQQPVQRWLLDTPVVFYRKEAGQVVAMEDRCPHRLVPLSMGERVGDNIRCVYHGAVFNPEGKCESLPGSTAQARCNGVRTFPIEERWGAIFIWMGEREKADAGLLPPAQLLRREGRRTVRGVLPCKADYQLCVDNLLDLSHEAYLHPHTIGTLEVAEIPVETKVDANKVTVARLMKNVEAPKLFAEAKGIDANIDRYQTVTAYLPSFVTVDVKATPVGEPDYDDPLEWQVLFFMTPERGDSTHYFFAVSRGFGLDSEPIDEALKAGALKTIHEDIEMLEAQQAMLETIPLQDRTLYTRYDVAPDRARIIVDKMASQEKEKEPT